jgi:hypothetical protein
MITEQTIQQVLAALRFYADGDNRVLLTGFKNGKRIDWKQERANLESRGFTMNCELYDGSEDFIEDGSVAAAALTALEKELDQS